jgi:hypothetical protein
MPSSSAMSTLARSRTVLNDTRQQPRLSAAAALAVRVASLRRCRFDNERDLPIVDVRIGDSTRDENRDRYLDFGSKLK